MDAKQAQSLIDNTLLETAIEDCQRARAELGVVVSGTPQYQRAQALAKQEAFLRRTVSRSARRGAQPYAGHCVTR